MASVAMGRDDSREPWGELRQGRVLVVGFTALTGASAARLFERKGIPYQVIEPRDSDRRSVAYADNFAFRRVEPWTH